MKPRISTSISLSADYWVEKIEPILKEMSFIDIVRLGVETWWKKKSLDKNK